MQHPHDPTSRATWEGLLRPFADAQPTDTPPIHPFGDDDPAIAAWAWCLGSGDLDAYRELPGRRRGGEGPRPLLATRDDLAIEVWTECELAVLHAGFRRLLESEARGEDAPTAVIERLQLDLQDAVAWHLEHTQPDNATTHPWGLHAVLEFGSPTAEAIDHAGSMLHAMQAAAVMTPDGRPDPLSRWIAADLVRTLSSLGPGPIGGRC